MSQEGNEEGNTGARARVQSTVAKGLAKLEQLHSEENAFVLGPGSIFLMGLSCAGILGVGFKLGMKRQIEGKNDHIVPKSLAERVATQQGKQPEIKPTTIKYKPSAPAPLLAFRALGYATVLTVCTATLVTLTGVAIFDIKDPEDLIARLKRNVPEASKKLQTVFGPALEGTRDSMQGIFKRFRPAIAPKGRNGDLSGDLEQEKAELRELGVDVSILEPAPAPIRNIGVFDDDKK
uniref:Transmembrane protein 242 n=1 Tax=Mucochytrium quahogii TaxID=96639 RepID=A0A7S2S4L2_9STRA|mmetsp:Transcript_8924/g.14514  ORF Transcript_8924/g.14514 Transcript_8924/m.14514 type:complete len:235 (-) Transcript_8924:267-971(-)|eukprot:CAMPEP_0203763118 /NCGR_PEP_ID=MMETSP0098-20131031/15801_1 /ASSEMBLY_ACC=CAM_ASM_000208 /TAXON_ID=96639 /ORGANISM=" , Strain NY0313808BC1" /LENGTH=234 /DNA_ID=CAMNT_0050657725 /DNA_START=287 /DNA_END=991 /DNA_ORIENTATION=-